MAMPTFRSFILLLSMSALTLGAIELHEVQKHERSLAGLVSCARYCLACPIGRVVAPLADGTEHL